MALFRRQINLSLFGHYVNKYKGKDRMTGYGGRDRRGGRTRREGYGPMFCIPTSRYPVRPSFPVHR
jgi:hypothetical protein